MNLSIYNLADLNMYLRGTFGVFEGLPSEIRSIDGTDSEGNCVDGVYSHIKIELQRIDTISNILLPKDGHIALTPVPLGYRNTARGVVFLTMVQSNSYKKLPTRGAISVFTPNEYELATVRTDPESTQSLGRRTLLTPITYTPVKEACTVLKTGHKLAVALHKNYALVKKGYNKDPIMYYKKDPVAVFTDGELHALKNSMYIDKFYGEVTTSCE